MLKTATCLSAAGVLFASLLIYQPQAHGDPQDERLRVRPEVVRPQIEVQVPLQVERPDLITLPPGFVEKTLVYSDGTRRKIRLPATSEKPSIRRNVPVTRGLSRPGLPTGPRPGRLAEHVGAGAEIALPGRFTGPRTATRSTLGAAAAWYDTTIPVCWENIDTAPADGRAWTRDAVENSWAKISNISFAGWGACEEDSSGIRIKVAEAAPYAAKLGRGLDGLEDGMVLNFTFARWGRGCAANREYCIRALAVHEFGHGIGLAHEHNRSDVEDVADREICRAEPQGPDAVFYMTAYDPDSVMNYCAKDWNNAGNLTALDVAAVRMVYGPFDDKTPAVVEYLADISFEHPDGGIFAPEPSTHTFTLSETVPSETFTDWLCNEDNLLVKLSATASLVPGKPHISIINDLTLYETRNCRRGGQEVDTQNIETLLTEPLEYPMFQTADFEPPRTGMGETRITIVPRRAVDEQSILDNCGSCAELAAAAIFRATEPPAPTTQWAVSSPALSTSGRDAIWFEPNISVCWEDMAPEHADGRAWTARAVTQTWQRVSDVRFNGWEACNDDAPFHGIRIALADTGPHVAMLGRQLAGVPAGMTLNFSFQSWGQKCATHREYCIKTLAVHEFGHALGLAHEHNRADRTACDKEPQGPMPAYVLTAYDPGSVMNYCADSWNNDGKLSTLDVLGVRAMYGPFDDDLPMHLIQRATVTFEHGGDAARQTHEHTFDAKLTKANNMVREALPICDGNGLLVELSSETSLPEGATRARIMTTMNTYETSDCTTKGALVDAFSSQLSLPPPGEEVFALSHELFEYGDDVADGPLRTINVIVTPERILGADVEAGDCASCAAAAETARFGPETPPLALAGTGFQTVAAAASPWPDDFDIDLEVCANAVRTGPSYGADDWSEQNIKTLCDAAPTSEEPVKCFAKLVNAGAEWGPNQARDICAGADNADTVIDCFSEQTARGASARDVIAACAAQ